MLLDWTALVPAVIEWCLHIPTGNRAVSRVENVNRLNENCDMQNVKLWVKMPHEWDCDWTCEKGVRLQLKIWIKSEIVKCQICLHPTSTHPLFNHPNIKTKLSRLNVGGFNRKYFNLIIPHGPWHGATVQKAPFLHNMWTVPYIIYGFVQCCMCTKDGILSPVVSVYIRIYLYISVYIRV